MRKTSDHSLQHNFQAGRGAVVVSRWGVLQRSDPPASRKLASRRSCCPFGSQQRGKVSSMLLQLHGGGEIRRRQVRARSGRHLLDARAMAFVDNEPIDACSRIECVDSGAVEIDRGLRAESAGAGGCASDLDRLLDRFGVEMQRAGSTFGSSPAATSSGCVTLIPALVLHQNLHGWMGRQFELLLDLCCRGRCSLRKCFTRMAVSWQPPRAAPSSIWLNSREVAAIVVAAESTTWRLRPTPVRAWFECR